MAQTPSKVWSRRLVVALATSGMTLPLVGVLPAQAASAAKPYDFDGDGRAELVVGAPRLDVGSHERAGGVVLLESEGGPFGQTTITQSSARVAGASERFDGFGSAVASADFDRDGYADLAVGLPGEDLGKSKKAGAVTVLYGSSTGLGGKRSKQVQEPSGRSKDASFGAALAVGDVSGDGYPDLVVSAPDEDVDEQSADQAGGTVTVLPGSAKGVQTKGYRQVEGVRTADGDPGFGSLLAVADVDADGRPDVVVGAATRPDLTDDTTAAGSVSYCAGGNGGPTSCQRLAYGEELGGIRALTVGNVAGDARPEILVGVPFVQTPVQVLGLSGTGSATTATPRGFDPQRPQLPRDRTDFDSFGASLATADVNGDGYDDLAIGAPGTVVDDEDFAGRAYVVLGSEAGLDAGRGFAYDQSTAGIPGGAEEDDELGAALTLLDVSGDGRPDLTVGAPGEDNDLGSVTTLFGGAGALTAQGSKRFSPRNVPDRPQSELAFGEVLGR